MALIKEFIKDKLKVSVYDTNKEMGAAAANDAALELIRLQANLNEINIMFAAAKSQISMLDILCTNKAIDFSKVNAFHMDEYAGLSADNPSSLAYYLTSRHLDKLNLKGIYFMNDENASYDEVCLKYAEILKAHPLDICFLGIGDNGHLAFNEPHIADFNETSWVRMVEIDDISKIQQVNAGNFPTVQDVPSLAYTVTIPVLLSAKRKFCVAPGKEKAKAVHMTLTGEITKECPASILRQDENTHLYLDKESAEMVLNMF